MWREHAIETAKVLNQIDPDFIRVRTFKALEIMPVYRRIEAGELELMNDDEIIAEERLLIENLDGITSYFASDHILNLLEELDGKFPEAKETMLATIDRYLGMSLEERNNFRLGRRAGYYRTLDDMVNAELRTRVNSIMQRIEKENPGGLGFGDFGVDGWIHISSPIRTRRNRYRIDRNRLSDLRFDDRQADTDSDTDSDSDPMAWNPRLLFLSEFNQQAAG